MSKRVLTPLSYEDEGGYRFTVNIDGEKYNVCFVRYPTFWLWVARDLDGETVAKGDASVTSDRNGPWEARLAIEKELARLLDSDVEPIENETESNTFRGLVDDEKLRTHPYEPPVCPRCGLPLGRVEVKAVDQFVFDARDATYSRSPCFGDIEVYHVDCGMLLPGHIFPEGPVNYEGD